MIETISSQLTVDELVQLDGTNGYRIEPRSTDINLPIQDALLLYVLRSTEVDVILTPKESQGEIVRHNFRRDNINSAFFKRTGSVVEEVAVHQQ